MPVRMIVEQSVTQPQYRVIAKATCQQRFDLAPVKVRITVGIEQALLSGDGKAGAISVHRTAFENPVSLRAGHLHLGSEQCANIRSEEHTSEPVTNAHLVCRLLL